MRRPVKLTLDFSVRTIYNLCADKKGGEPMSPTQGRPKIENPKTERLYIRITPEERRKFNSSANPQGILCWS